MPALAHAQREKFAQLVVETANASEAYRQAYPRSRSWKPQAVHVCACKLAAVPKVKERIEELREARALSFQKEAENRGVTVARVLEEQAFTAFLDPATMFGKAGELLEVQAMPEATRRAVKKVKLRRVGEDAEVVEVELHDKLSALKAIGEHLGMYKQLHEHTHRYEDLSDDQLREELDLVARQREELESMRNSHRKTDAPVTH